jgi:hypothetical protein
VRATGAALEATAPAAVLAASGRARWRDPRVAIGLAIMAASVLLGGWLLASGRQTTSVLVLRGDLPKGSPLSASAVTVEQVRFGSTASAGRYLHTLPPGAVLARSVAAGTLLSAEELEHGRRAPQVEVPLSVGVDDLPSTVSVGSTVDVWVVADVDSAGAGSSTADSAGAESVATAIRVLAAVRVVRMGAGPGSLSPESTRQVIVDVPVGRGSGAPSPALVRALGAAASGRVVLTREE